MKWLRQPGECVVHESPNEAITDLSRLHLWIADLDAGEWGRGPAYLSRGELARAARLKDEVQRRRYLSSRIFVRRVLGNLADLNPASVEFAEDSCGKPHLSSSSGSCPRIPTLGFNLSHSDEAFGLAVAFGREVGLDLEVVAQDIDEVGVASTVLVSDELYALLAAPPERRASAFYEIWTAKEACAKMEGVGIGRRAGSRTVAEVHTFEFVLGMKDVIGTVAVGSSP